jgi:hypothetical protein
MELASEIPPDAATAQQTNSASAALPRRSKTRQGKARLLTLNALDARTAAYTDALKLRSRTSAKAA